MRLSLLASLSLFSFSLLTLSSQAFGADTSPQAFDPSTSRVESAYFGTNGTESWRSGSDFGVNDIKIRCLGGERQGHGFDNLIVLLKDKVGTQRRIAVPLKISYDLKNFGCGDVAPPADGGPFLASVDAAAGTRLSDLFGTYRGSMKSVGLVVGPVFGSFDNENDVALKLYGLRALGLNYQTGQIVLAPEANFYVVDTPAGVKPDQYGRSENYLKLPIESASSIILEPSTAR